MPCVPSPIPQLSATKVCNHFAIYLGLQVKSRSHRNSPKASVLELQTPAQIQKWTDSLQGLATILPWDTDSAVSFATLARYSAKLALRKNCPEQALILLREYFEAADLDDNPKRRLQRCLAAGTTMYRLTKRLHGVDDVRTVRAAVTLLPFVIERGHREKIVHLSSYIQHRLHLEPSEREVIRTRAILELVKAWLMKS